MHATRFFLCNSLSPHPSTYVRRTDNPSPVFLSLFPLLGVVDMSRTSKYFNEPAICTCQSCVAENPSGRILTRQDVKTHADRESRQSSAIRQRGMPRMNAPSSSRGTVSRLRPISIRGRQAPVTKTLPLTGRNRQEHVQSASSSQPTTAVDAEHPTHFDSISEDIQNTVRILIHN
jgi:hypothetical protein